MAALNAITSHNGQSDAALKDRFFRYFQHEVTALQEQMDRLNTTAWTGGERNDAVDHCLAGIERLNHEVKDASSYIPAYDQRTYGEAVKALSAKLQTIRTQFAPPKKFQFKTGRKNNSAISLSDAAELARQNKLGVPGYSSDTSNANSSFAPTPLDKLSPTEEKPLEFPSHDGGNSKGDDFSEPRIDGTAAGVRTMSFSDANSVTISNHNKTHILLPTSASHATSSGTVSNLRNSVVDLSPPTTNGGPFASLTLKNIKRSLIVCGQVTGPAHITGVENSVLVVACRQFRVHNSKNVDVYLFCASRPIIEDCENIRFAPLPEAYNPPDFATIPNLWNQIDDFKWLKSEPSPNYSVLVPDERVQEKVWKETVPGGHNVGLDDILRAVSILH
ncbi:TBCC-domain-containing protein [Aaosphaeria arxii CBS 175.79]|uniref:TBCC-domain-containing protein n=1 Tax=Aaosphaeria arxii CBS 175.79 TaxID=1450172 RepID=A0A6A5XF69_9PLEO|nr:TBCC-domain-containing protein [Aaosphaeria arxii CBS 175.79]KAF2011768.1 TBCC-domain-containing protein [Aaosphaeria arxii CBS 175.79]